MRWRILEYIACSEHFKDVIVSMICKTGNFLRLPQKRRLKKLMVPGLKLQALNTGEDNSAGTEK